jgi:hypothetical protein
MHHFETVKKSFSNWEYEIRKKNILEPVYPDINLQPPRDDIINYSDNW